MVTTCRLLLLLALVVILPTGTRGTCGDSEVGGIANGFYCYLFSHELMNFYDANALCEHMDFDYYYQDSVEYDAELFQALNYYGRRGEYWTSGNDLTWEGVWAWAEFDYHIMEEAFDNWAPNRPSIDSRRNCLYIRYDGGSAMWYDGNCQLRKHALCFG
ncbi:hypothetical protein ScPMuIL_011740 [Solemya velum]